MNRNIIAILRGISPDEVIDLGASLVSAGIDAIEVPLHSPACFRSIELLLNHFGDSATIGAGTVLQTNQVARLKQIGAHMVVSPNTNTQVIAATKDAGMLSFPGVMTPGECFSALGAGADGLKLFPGEIIGQSGCRAIRAVLPRSIVCLAVGGIKADNLGQWMIAGADGCGTGSWLYTPGDTADQVAIKAKHLVAVYDQHI